MRFLRANKEIFAWEPNQLVGVPREVIQHHLRVCPNIRPVKQRARQQSTEKQAFIVQEKRKLEAQVPSERSDTPNGWRTLS